jgi:CSLREA domain-containing protein
MRIALLALLAVVAIGLAPAAPALVFIVTSTADAVDVNPGDGICDSNPSPSVQVCTLRAAVQEANASAGVDTIGLGEGTYSLTIAGIEELAAAGDLDANSTIIIEGAGMLETVIEQTTADRVFETGLSTGDLTLRDLTVSGGDVTTAPNTFGGGIRNIGRLELERVRITGNSAVIGGGVANFKTMIAREVWISDNTVTSRAAGLVSGSFSASGPPPTTLSMSDSTVGPNTAPGIAAEMELANAQGVVLTNVTVSPESTEQQSVSIGNQFVTLSHVTLLGGLSLFSFDESHEVTFENSAIGYCTSNEGSTPLIVRNGANASTDASCGFAAAGGLEGDLGLGPLADNGGSAPTHLPLAGSLLVDAAAADFCVETDQRGFARPAGAACDIGAIEVPEPGAAAAAGAAVVALGLARRRSA